MAFIDDSGGREIQLMLNLGELGKGRGRFLASASMAPARYLEVKNMTTPSGLIFIVQFVETVMFLVVPG